MINLLGEFIIDEFLKQMNAWQRVGIDITLAFNVSPKQFLDPNFEYYLLKKIREYNADPAKITLEFTETAFVTDFLNIAQRLQLLREAGIRIALDDFGTGYSSLSRLAELPIDILKIDKSFIDKIHINSTSSAVVQSIIALARAFNLVIVAEGVETIGQVNVLKEFGCDKLQGFYYSAPIPAKDFERFYVKTGQTINKQDLCIRTPAII